jgi:hypothetical protein
MSFHPFIVVNLGTVFLQGFGATAAVFKAVKMNPDPFVMECLYLEQHFKCSSIIGRIWHVQANDVQMLVQS